MKSHANILVVSDHAEAAQTIRTTLEQAGHACTVITKPGEALEEARSGRYDLVITGLGGDDGITLLQAARASDPSCQVIVLAPQSSAAEAVAAMKAGALTYLQIPVNPLELSAVVERAVERVSLERDHAVMQTELARRYRFDNIVGNSPPMQKVFQRISQIAATDVTVLLQGETGTGKELVARALHYHSNRRHNRFVPLNCAGLVETILESELFGHQRGAFTGAVSTRIGLFEYADHGTLFLDEIGDMPPSSQMKLLRVLEQGEIVRVGSNEPIRVDVRLIAATNRNLQDKIKDGSFRQDLFYRLNVITINLPPLREHPSDIPLLIERFAREFVDAYGKPAHGLSQAARNALFHYGWPGNVRELRNAIEHMVVATTDDVLGEDDLPDYLQSQPAGALQEPTIASMIGQPLEEVEREHIARTLEMANGNREKAAEMLGIGERTLYRKIEKYGLR